MIQLLGMKELPAGAVSILPLKRGDYKAIGTEGKPNALITEKE